MKNITYGRCLIARAIRVDKAFQTNSIYSCACAAYGRMRKQTTDHSNAKHCIEDTFDNTTYTQVVRYQHKYAYVSKH